MEAGAHVLCEKPLATNSEEALRMVRKAEFTNRVLATVFNYRHRGDVRVLRQIVRDGTLGRVYYAKASWMRRRHYDVSGWYTSKSASGGGPVIDLGVHVLDLVLFLLGEPAVTRVSGATYAALVPRWLASQGRDPASWEVEDLGAGMLSTKDGTAIMLEASWASHGAHADDEMTITLYGTDAGASLRVRDYAPRGSLRLFGELHGQLMDTRASVPTGDGHRGVAREFVSVIRTGDWSAHRGYEGLERSRILDAFYRSAELGREVVLDEQTRRPVEQR